MFSYGKWPYSGRNPDSEFINWLYSGGRMDLPQNHPSEMFVELIFYCILIKALFF